VQQVGQGGEPCPVSLSARWRRDAGRYGLTGNEREERHVVADLPPRAIRVIAPDAVLASGLLDVDTRRDAVAIVSTSEQLSWDQASFTTAADDLRRRLDSVAQNTPLDELVSLALRPGVGAVGGQLLYPDGTIQHAGIVTGLILALALSIPFFFAMRYAGALHEAV